MTYGNSSQSTFSVPHATDISWYYDDTNSAESARIDSAQSPGLDRLSSEQTAYQDYFNKRNETLTKRFPIDLLNSKGSVRIRVIAEHVTKRVEMAHIQIPVFNLLDCVCDLGEGKSYTRWFPLFLTKASIPSEGESERFEQTLVTEQSHPFEYHPCIRLKFGWIPDKSEGAEASRLSKEQKTYWRLSMPSLSVSIIDSDNAREIVQLCSSRIEIRNYTNKEHTDTLAYIDSFQVRLI
jgi:hypothetical protein